jgi:hypothetical protein
VAIPLADQKSTAHDPGFTNRVEPATVRVAWAKFTATANSDATIQTKRIALADAIIAQPGFATAQFSYLITTQAGFTSVDAITDAQIGTQVDNMFDQIAQMIMPS